jgi:hypothetical protein
VDLSGVRVHTDTVAAESAAAVGARAYTVGQDLVFGAGEYRPGTEEGLRLIAHEVGHLGTGVVRREQFQGSRNDPAMSSAGKHSGRPRPLLDKLLQSYLNRRELGGTAYHGLDNGFPQDTSPPPSFEAALDGLNAAAWAILDNCYSRLNGVGAWHLVDAIYYVWQSPSAEGFDIGTSPAKLQAFLQHSSRFCLDTLPFDHFHSSGLAPPVKEFLTKHPWYREIGCEGEALHMSAARTPETWGAFMHIDKTGIAGKRLPGLGTCRMCLKQTIKHGKENLPHFKEQARGIIRQAQDKMEEWAPW